MLPNLSVSLLPILIPVKVNKKLIVEKIIDANILLLHTADNPIPTEKLSILTVKAKSNTEIITCKSTTH